MIYEYSCLCGHRWEASQRLADEPLHDCPACHAPTAKRLVTGGQGFLLKGSGWARDGYGRAKEKDDGND